MRYSASQINDALNRIDSLKDKHPVGWGHLDEIGLPGESIMIYALRLGNQHAPRLGMEDDISLVYSTGWLQGLGVGVLLGHEEPDDPVDP